MSRSQSNFWSFQTEGLEDSNSGNTSWRHVHWPLGHSDSYFCRDCSTNFVLLPFLPYQLKAKLNNEGLKKTVYKMLLQNGSILGLFFIYFSLFKQQYAQFLQINLKVIHLVSSAGIQTNNHLIMSLLPLPPDQGSFPNLSIVAFLSLWMRQNCSTAWTSVSEGLLAVHAERDQATRPASEIHLMVYQSKMELSQWCLQLHFLQFGHPGLRIPSRSASLFTFKTVSA